MVPTRKELLLKRLYNPHHSRRIIPWFDLSFGWVMVLVRGESRTDVTLSAGGSLNHNLAARRAKALSARYKTGYASTFCCSIKKTSDSASWWVSSSFATDAVSFLSLTFPLFAIFQSETLHRQPKAARSRGFNCRSLGQRTEVETPYGRI